MKKILQKSLSQLRMLLILAVMFVAGASAWAQDPDAAFSITGKSNTDQSGTVNGVNWTCHLEAWAGGANFYSYDTDLFTVEAPESKVITKIVMTLCDQTNTGGTATLDRDGADVGELVYGDGKATWTGESDYVQYKRTGSRDWSFNYVEVWLADAGADDGSVKSTLNFDSWNLSYSGGSSKPASSTHFNNGEVFSNADGVTMTLTNIPDPQAWPSECFYSNPSGSTMALYLCNGEGFTIAAPTGYTLSKILVNRASTSYSMTSLIIDGVQNADATKGTWTGDAASVAFSTISGDASKRILINNIQVTLTPIEEEGEVTYTIDLVDAPAGAYVTLDGETFDRDNTYTVEKSLGKSDLEAYEPEGYYAEVEYTRDSHTYTVTYKAYNYYDVTVTGTSDANAGVVYGGHTYGDGDRIESKDVLTLSSVTPADVTGYAGTVSMSGNAYTVDYQEKLDYVIATNTGLTTISQDGFTITGGGVYTGNCINLWSSWTLTVESSTLPIERIELEEYAGKTITASSSPEGYNGNNAWVGTPTNRVTFTATNNGDFCIKSVHIYLYKPVPVDYTIDLEGAPAGASVRVNDDQDFDADGTYTTTDKLTASNISVTCPESYEYEVTYNEGTHTFTITFTALPEYTYAIAIYPQTEDFKITIDGNEYGDTGMGDITLYRLLTVGDINAPVQPGYEAPVVEITKAADYYYLIDVTYKALPVVTIGSSATDSEGNYWTSFCFNKPVSFGEGVTPCLVTGAENGKLTIEEFEKVSTEASVFYDFQNNEVERIGNGLYIEGDNHDVSMTISGSEIYQSVSPGQGRIEGAGSVTISHPENISKVIVTPWGGGYGANVSLDGAAPVNVGTESYTFNVNAPSCTLGLTSNGNGVYIFAIEVVVGGETVPVFPANTGILVKSDEAKAVSYSVCEAGEVNVDASANLLKASGESGFSVSNDASHLYYKLTLNAAGEAGTAGFYWDKNSDEGHSINVPAHKAYLMLDAAAASNYRAYLFGGEGEATGIEAAATVEDNAPVYNLQGQRVNAAKAGVYVKNGKKMIVK